MSVGALHALKRPQTLDVEIGFITCWRSSRCWSGSLGHHGVGTATEPLQRLAAWTAFCRRGRRDGPGPVGARSMGMLAWRGFKDAWVDRTEKVPDDSLAVVVWGYAWWHRKQRDGGGWQSGVSEQTRNPDIKLARGGTLTRARVDVVIGAPRAVTIHCRAVLYDHANTGIRVQGRLLRRRKQGASGVRSWHSQACRNNGLKRPPFLPPSSSFLQASVGGSG